MALETEIDTYARLLPALRADQGRWALIQGTSHAGTFDTYRDAITIGYERFGLEPFMVKRIEANPSTVFARHATRFEG